MFFFYKIGTIYSLTYYKKNKGIEEPVHDTAYVSVLVDDDFVNTSNDVMRMAGYPTDHENR